MVILIKIGMPISSIVLFLKLSRDKEEELEKEDLETTKPEFKKSDDMSPKEFLEAFRPVWEYKKQQIPVNLITTNKE